MISDREFLRKMKILVVCQNYWPEPFPLTNLCESLAERGHEVHVITDVPNYPMGYIYPEYKGGKQREQERNGVRISRTFTVGRRNNLVFRMLNYISYAVSSTLYAKRLREDYDVVFTAQGSPILMVNAAMAYAKKHKKKTVLYCMDLWPASLAAGGVKESSALYRIFCKISCRLYGQADRILITSQMFRRYLESELNIPDSRIAYLPQYAEERFAACEVKHAEQKNTVDLMFAGNIGAAQSVSTMIRAAEILKEDPRIRWHLVGDGSALEDAKKLSVQLGLTCVIFHGRRPIEEMPEYYAMADAMLITLTADPLISMTLPAKVQSYMAAGKPIIAAATGEIPDVIEKSGCGFCAEAEDALGLADAVRRFLSCEEKTLMGARGKQYYQEHFSRERAIAKLEQELYAHCTFKQ